MRRPGRWWSTAVFILLATQLWWASCHDDNDENQQLLDDDSKPLILTPYLKKKQIQEALKASQVSHAGLNKIAPSYTGYFQVDEKLDSNLFFWYIPCQAQNVSGDVPLVVWLQGGPGTPGMFGLFAEHGPFVIKDDMSIEQRQYAWTKEFNMLYFDQPVGTGFSFTGSDEGYARDQDTVANNLYEAMTQFYQLFPKLKTNILALAGESYGGKYVPSLAFKIHEENKKLNAKNQMKLRGLAIGDGLYDAVQQLDHGAHLFQIGLADESNVDKFDSLHSEAKQHVENGEYDQAAEIFSSSEYYKKETGLWDVENYSTDLKGDPPEYTNHKAFLKRPEVKKAIHVGNQEFGVSNGKAHDALNEDIPKSSLPKLTQLLNAKCSNSYCYKVLVYHGQLDMNIPYPTTQKMFSNMSWLNGDDYRKSERKAWFLNKNDAAPPAGYVRETENFIEVLVRNAGHVVPHDQPERAYELVTRFGKGQPLITRSHRSATSEANRRHGGSEVGADDVMMTSDYVGEPLFLSEYIATNELEQARNDSRVTHQGLNQVAPSHSGFFTVNARHQSNIFFWYIPAQNATTEHAPLLLWLQGGPGASSLFGLFVENGPYVVTSDLNVTRRDFAWTQEYHMLYIDQPVGTGFSFTNGAYAKSETDVANDLYEALRQFFIVFPDLLQSDFYVTGESYAGKYVPAIADKIDRMNEAGNDPRIPLKGLAVGDGLYDPLQQLYYGDFIVQTGLGDEQDKAEFKKLIQNATDLIQRNQSAQAGKVFNDITNYFVSITQLKNPWNYLLDIGPDFKYEAFVESPSVRKGIHVGDKTYHTDVTTVFDHLAEDIPLSSGPLIKKLLDKSYKVMLYNGQVDVNIVYSETEKFIRNLDWKGKELYRLAYREIWKLDGNVAGYAKEVLTLRQVMVRNAGHLVPADKPKEALDMMHKFVNNEPFGESPFHSAAINSLNPQNKALVVITSFVFQCLALYVLA